MGSKRGLSKKKGHLTGLLKVVPEITRKAFEDGLNTLTFWWFSTENWNREPEEIKDLIKICETSLKILVPIAQSLDARIVYLGRKDRLPQSLLETMVTVENETKNNNVHFLFIALDYGGRDELERAAEKLKSSNQGLSFATFLDSACSSPYPNPDILIRTSGEQRLSGFMSWQMEYAELFFIKELFPALTYDKVLSVVEEFAGNRRRRFGK